jgi:peptidyl-prolyl cis-trans isomerase B (cyclophilin B)
MRCITSGCCLLLLGLAGCSRPAAPVKSGETEPAAAAVAAAPGAAQDKAPAPKAKDERARLQQSFKEAVIADPPVNDEQLPDLTVTGKNVTKIYAAVAGKRGEGGLWDQVKLVDDKGQVVKYRAVVSTKLGPIHIDLYPEAAPNHVRSFIALARAGYFDGLPIYKSVRESEGNVLNAYLESGCPKGTGEVGYGSIGYWLKPEIEGNKLSHDEGAVGASHREELETASARFYITAEKMPHMDGSFTVFGKVSRGLDIVRTINSAPVEDKVGFRLKEPVPIEKVVIETIEP